MGIVIDAAERFHRRGRLATRDRTRAEHWVFLQGREPFVRTECGWRGTLLELHETDADALARVLFALARFDPAYRYAAGVFYDRSTGSRVVVYYDADLLDVLGYAAPPDDIDVRIDEDWFRIETRPLPPSPASRPAR